MTSTPSARFRERVSRIDAEFGAAIRAMYTIESDDVVHNHHDALNDQGLDNGELLEWYRRLGFELEDPDLSDPDENHYIVRRATAPLPSP